MPELPDVEVFRRYVDATSLHRDIDHAMVPDSRVLDSSPTTLRRHLQGHRLIGTHRHGKYLFTHLDHGPWLLLHFGMTGSPVAYERADREPDHVRLRLDFADGRHLAYRNTRLFGTVAIVHDPAENVRERGLGPDALDLDLDGFRDRLDGRRGMVKSTLMNQSVLAGLGNVWTDEILFQARIHPKTRIPDLGAAVERRLFSTMCRVIERSIEFHADPERAPEHYLLRHREPGTRCPRECGGDVRRISVSGRPTYLCPSCQGDGSGSR